MPSMNPQPPKPQPQPPEATKPPQKHVARNAGILAGALVLALGGAWTIVQLLPKYDWNRGGRPMPRAKAGGGPSAVVRADPNSGPVFAKLTGPVSVAILSGVGPDAPPDVAGATLMQALQATPGVRLVERDRIRQILSELQLGNAGVSDASRALRLGRIVAADLMVMVTAPTPAAGATGAPAVRAADAAPRAGVAGPSQAPAPPPPAPGLARVRVIDTRTGIILDRFELTAKSATDAAGTAQRLQAALGRRAGDPAKRRYLGVYDVRSEEIGRHLDPVAESLRAVIEYELSRNPDVLVLDREDLRRMTDEKYLADLPVALKISTTLLTCGVRRTDANGGLAATFALTPLGGGKGPTGTLPGSSRELAALGRSVATGVLRDLSLQPPAARPASPAAEADTFMLKARVLESDGRIADAARCAEVSLAIDPTVPRRTEAIRQWRLAAENVLFSVETADRLRAALRADQLEVERIAELESRIRADTRRPKSVAVREEASPFFRHYSAWDLLRVFSRALQWRVEPGDVDAVQARADLVEFETDKYDRLVRLQRQYGWSCVDLLGVKIVNAEFLAPAPGGVSKIILGAIDEYEKEAAAGALSPQVRANFYKLVAVALAADVRVLFRDKVRPPPEPFATHSDPYVRLIGRAAAAGLYDDRGGPKTDAAAARAVLDTNLSDLPSDERSRDLTFRYEDEMSLFRDPIGGAILAMTRRSPRAAAEYLDRLLEEAERTRDVSRLVTHARVVEKLLSHVPAAQAEMEGQRLLAAVRPGSTSAADEARRSYLESVIHNRLDSLAGRGPTGPDPWEDFTVRQVEISGLRPGAQLLWSDLAGDEFIMLWHVNEFAPGAPPVERLELTRVSADGGPVTQIATLDGRTLPSQVICGAPLGDSWYYGTQNGGMIVAGPGGISVVPTPDLPPIECLAAAGGKVYLGHRDGMSRFDPTTRAIETVASSHAVRATNPLDGGAAYVVRSMLSDPARGGIWLGVTGSRRGVWFFETATGRMHSNDETGEYEPSDLIWDGNVIDLATTKGPARYDPESGRMTVLKGFNNWVIQAMSKRHLYCVLGDDRVLADFMMCANTGFNGAGSFNGFIGRWRDGAYALPAGAWPGRTILPIERITRRSAPAAPKQQHGPGR